MGWLTEGVAKLFLSTLGAPVVDKIASTVLEWHKTNVAAAGSREALEAELAKREIDLRQRDRELTVETQKLAPTWVIGTLMLLAAVPPLAYLGKLYIWDKMLGWGQTDPLSPFLEAHVNTIIMSLFGYGAVSTAASGAVRVAGLLTRRKG